MGKFMGQVKETQKRTIVRMITYRLTAWAFTIFWTWLIMGDLAKSTGFATTLHLLLSIDYYIHERIWLKIKWGRK
jgi:adenylylsulfate kinase